MRNFKIVQLLRNFTCRQLDAHSIHSVNYISIRQKLCILGRNVEIIQHVNKTPCLYVQQGKHPPINIQNFSHLHVYTYLHS